MVWTPPGGAKKTAKAEYWKPKKKGETIMGIVSRFGDSHFGRFVVLSPVILYPDTGEPSGFLSLAVGINSWLEKVVKGEHTGTPLAIRYVGPEKTPKGYMRTFEVFEISPADWQEDQQKYVDVSAFDDVETDDDEPPF